MSAQDSKAPASPSKVTVEETHATPKSGEQVVTPWEVSVASPVYHTWDDRESVSLPPPLPHSLILTFSIGRGRRRRRRIPDH